MLHATTPRIDTHPAPHISQTGREVRQLAETDDGYRKSLLSLLRLVRRPMAVKELAQACVLGERRVRALLEDLVDEMEVRAVSLQEAGGGPDRYCATAISRRFR